MTFILKNDVNILSKNNKLNIFLFAVGVFKRSLTQRAGSGSISQKYGSEDPYQNFTDPEHR